MVVCGVGQPRMKWLPVGTPTEGRERASSSPKSKGGSEHWLRSKDSLAGTLSTEVGLRDTTKGVECNVVEAARVDIRCVSLPFRCTVGWHWSRAAALLCGHRGCCPACMMSALIGAAALIVAIPASRGMSTGSV